MYHAKCHLLQRSILSIQFILNCGSDTAGSCHGGSHSGTYEFIKNEAGLVPYDTCMPYIACSSESREGFCKEVDTTCKPINTCCTCNTFEEQGRTCVEINSFPNATSECCFCLFVHLSLLRLQYSS